MENETGIEGQAGPPDGERSDTPERLGPGIGGAIISLAVLALVAVIAFFMLDQRREERLAARNGQPPTAASTANPQGRN